MKLTRIFLLVSIILSIDTSSLFATNVSEQQLSEISDPELEVTYEPPRPAPGPQSVAAQTEPPRQVQGPENDSSSSCYHVKIISDRFPPDEEYPNCFRPRLHAQIFEKQGENCNEGEYVLCCINGLKQRVLYLCDGIIRNPITATGSAVFCACIPVGLTVATALCAVGSLCGVTGGLLCCEDACCRPARKCCVEGASCCALSATFFDAGAFLLADFAFVLARLPLNLLAPEAQSICGQHYAELCFAQRAEELINIILNI